MTNTRTGVALAAPSIEFITREVFCALLGEIEERLDRLEKALESAQRHQRREETRLDKLRLDVSEVKALA
jgi:ribosome-binding ATPase YchF (GTP1/OBG family)